MEYKMKLTLLIPCYNEESQIPETVREVPHHIPAGLDYELLFIDDGSSDRSWERLSEAARANPRIRALRFSRNFGKEAALTCGLLEASGDAVLIMDCDLQHPPCHIPEMVRLWQEGADVVEGVKSDRGKESFFSRLSARAFYKLFHSFSGLQLQDASDFKLLDRKVVEVWKKLPEQDPFFRGLSAWVGFKRQSFSFKVEERTHGQSKWTAFKLLRLSLDALIGFTSKPLLFISIIGMLLELCFLVLGIQTLVRHFSGHAVEGFTTVILLLLMIGGFILLSLGLIGIYIARIYEAGKNRPRYIIAEETGEVSRE